MRVLGSTATLFILVTLLEVSLRLQESWFHLMTSSPGISANWFTLIRPHQLWHHDLQPSLPTLEIRVSLGQIGGGWQPFRYSISTNSYGCRYEAVSAKKPHGAIRILVMGDSFTFGFRQGSTVAAVLERRLRSMGGTGSPRFEVMNCAVPSYSPKLILLRLRHQLRFLEPDFIIVNIDQTDMYDDFWRYGITPTRALVQREKEMPSSSCRHVSMEALLRYSYAVRWLGAALYTITVRHWQTLHDYAFHCGRQRLEHSIVRRDPLRDKVFLRQPAVYSFHLIRPSVHPYWDRATQALLKSLDDIIALCGAISASCAFTTYPHAGQIALPGKAAPLHRDMDHTIAEHLSSRGITYFDAFEKIATAQMSGMPVYFKQDMHFTPLGQQIWGEAFAAFFTQWILKQ